MTKAEIIDAVYEKVGGFSKKEAAEVVEAVFDTMKDVLAEGEKIKISGFGNFVVRAKKERIGRNPQTGAPIPISARRVLTFKPSQVLKTVARSRTSSASNHTPSAIGKPSSPRCVPKKRAAPIVSTAAGMSSSRCSFASSSTTRATQFQAHASASVTWDVIR
ncbi:MAG: integration host factor subunit alpha [Deltaproteobacteria bacterium]|nr:integration host factor subunit alpha [Deltaproteobacteria bacterium]